MNELVEYLEEHHNPGGNAIKFTGVETILKETRWTREEIFQLALEARDDEFITLSMKTGYRVGDNDPVSLDLIGLWNNVYRTMGKN